MKMKTIQFLTDNNLIMKLKEFNQENSRNIMTGRLTVRIYRRTGIFQFSKQAAEVLGLQIGSLVTIHQDEEHPEDFYFHKTSDPKGFILRGKGAELSGLTFNCSKVAVKILDLKKVEKSASFQISKQPMLINGLEYWPIITARLLSIK